MVTQALDLVYWLISPHPAEFRSEIIHLPEPERREERRRMTHPVVDELVDVGDFTSQESLAKLGAVASCIPHRGRRRFNAMPVRKRQGLLPDLLLTLQWQSRAPRRDFLMEVKRLHYGSTTYPAVSARCAAVARRHIACPLPMPLKLLASTQSTAVLRKAK